MTTRISGLSSGLDTDSIIKETLKPYQTKIDQKKQERDVTQAQQDQYRELVKASQDFFDKYFDITKSDSLLRDASYKTVNFTAGDGSEAATNNAPVTAKGLAGAAVNNYKVNVKALAQPANSTFDDSQLQNIKKMSVTINGQSVIISRDGANSKDFMNKINSQVTSLGMKMTYSDFTKEYILSTNATGTTAKFDIGITQNGDITKDSTTGTVTVANADTSSINKDKSGNIVFKDSTGVVTMSMDSAGNITPGTITPTKDTDGNDIFTDSKNNTITKYKDGTIVAKDASGNNTINSQVGKNADVDITDLTKNITINRTPSSNTDIVDNVQFNFNGVTVTKDTSGNITNNSPVTLTGATDVKDLKDKIVKFVDDYNTLIGKFNTKIYETRNKSYMPLTDDQKASMSDKQIEAWETKATTGLLRRDSDLQRITQGMKSAMGATQSLLESSGLSLEKIGIEPVKNYQDKNGTYKVDGDKLEEALKTNSDQIKTMFTKLPTSDTANDGGILQKLKKVLNDETMSSGSILSKKAGFEGTATYLDNTLTKQLKDEQKKIDEMTKSLSDREQKLYSKYSKLETAMNSLNSQQNWLTQQTAQ